MADNSKHSETKLKYILFEFFKVINQNRKISKFVGISLILISFFQIIYLLENLFIKGNVSETTSNYSIYMSMPIYDFIKIVEKFSMIIPILEYESEIFESFYTIIISFFYLLTLALFSGSIYLTHCIIQEKTVYYKFCISFISSIFLLLQWLLYLPLLYVFLYDAIRTSDRSIGLFSSKGVFVINSILSAIYILLGLLIAYLNNDSLNRYDNSFCRKDSNFEIMLYFLRSVLFFTYLFKLSQSLNNIISIASSIIVIVIVVRQFNTKYFYDEAISRIFPSVCVCFLKKLLDGFIVLVWNYYISDYSITLVFCFFMCYYIFDYIYRKKHTLILQKTLGQLKNIDEMLLYVEVLEEQANKACIGDAVAKSVIAGFIIEHKNSCKQPNCPLEAKELFHPLTNRLVEMKSNAVGDLYNNEILLIHLIKEIFIILNSKFYGNGHFHFAYASFLLTRTGNIKLCLIEIESSMRFSTNLQQEYSFYILKYKANEWLINNQFFIADKYSVLNLSILDILDVIVFDQLAKDLELGMYKCSKIKKEFWMIIKLKKILIEDLYRKGKEYLKQKEVVEKLWDKLSLITQANKKVIEIYNEYTESICDNPANINVEVKQKLSEDIDINDIMYNRFSDDICFFIISANMGLSMGCINYYNRAVHKMLGYNLEELLGKNISFIQPEPIAKVHNEILINFIETGRNKVIGKSVNLFAKDKEKYAKPVSILVMPMPSFSSQSEILGIMKEKNTSGFHILFDQYGIVDSFTKNFSLIDDSLDPNLIQSLGVELFIFYFFPELVQPQEDLNYKPLFLHERRLLELNTIHAYIDPVLLHILSQNDKKSNMPFNTSTKRKITNKYAKFIKDIARRGSSIVKEELKVKTEVYNDFKIYCHNMKEMIMPKAGEVNIGSGNIGSFKDTNFKEGNSTNNLNNLNNNLNNNLSNIPLPNNPRTSTIMLNKLNFKYMDEIYTDYYKNYKNYLDDTVAKEKDYNKMQGEGGNVIFSQNWEKISNISKKQYNCKIEVIKPVNKEKLYIMELTIPAHDVENEDDLLDYNSKSNGESIVSVLGGGSKNKSVEKLLKGDNNIDSLLMVGVDDTGSVSSSMNKPNATSIQNIAQRIRDEKNKDDRGNQASYMNWLLYLLLLILLAFIIFYNIYIYSYTAQQNLIVWGISYFFNFRDYLYEIRKLSYIQKVAFHDEIPNLELYNLNATLAKTCVNLLILNRNLTKTMIELSNKDYIHQLNYLTHNSSSVNGENQILSDIEDAILVDCIYISDPKEYNSDEIVSQFKTYLSIDFSDQNLTSVSFDERSSMIDYVLSNTNNMIQDKMDYKIFLLQKLFAEQNDTTMKLLTYCYIGLSCCAFVIMLIVFMILRKRYKINQKIIENLILINDEDIDELIKEIDKFLYYIQVRTNNKSLTESKDESDYDKENSFNDSNANDLLLGNTDRRPYSSKRKVAKTVNRKENIFISFTLNIILILALIVTYFVSVYSLSESFIVTYNQVFNFTQVIYKSQIINTKCIQNILDVYLSNDQDMYNETHKMSDLLEHFFEESKHADDMIFDVYSKNQTYYSSSIIEEFNNIFYGDVCDESVEISFNNKKLNCTFDQFDFTKVFVKGFKYGIDYYSNKIEKLISMYRIYHNIDNNHNFLDVFKERNEEFITPIVMDKRLLEVIYNYCIEVLNEKLFSTSNLFFIVIIIISAVCLILIFLSICTKWMKYVDQIQTEEYMSNKLIAEIPITVIMKNVGIITHLKEYASRYT